MDADEELPSDKARIEDEIARLRRRVARLEEELKRLQHVTNQLTAARQSPHTVASRVVPTTGPPVEP